MTRRARRSVKKPATRNARPLSRLIVNRADLLEKHMDRIQRLVTVSEEGAILTGIDVGRMLESETLNAAQKLILVHLLGKACARELGLAEHEGSTLGELKRVVAGLLMDVEDDEVMRYLGQLIRDGLVGYSERGIYVVNYLRLSDVLGFIEGELEDGKEVVGGPQG